MDMFTRCLIYDKWDFLKLLTVYMHLKIFMEKIFFIYCWIIVWIMSMIGKWTSCKCKAHLILIELYKVRYNRWRTSNILTFKWTQQTLHDLNMDCATDESHCFRWINKSNQQLSVKWQLVQTFLKHKYRNLVVWCRITWSTIKLF